MSMVQTRSVTMLTGKTDKEQRKNAVLAFENKKMLTS